MPTPAEKNRITKRATGQRRTELLAPAGNYECFLAAIHAGADAVYLAGKQFGARAAADNFSEEELISAIRYAHLFGRKVYMTVNTLLKDDELESLCGYLLPYVHAGLDAVIVQDFGVLSVIMREFPGLAVHCSTQMTITDEWGVQLAKELGAVRVVPARELTIDEIRRMKQACPGMELECFVHGAMCYCYSGQCLMSSLIGGRSGNRGACAQPCRLPYEVERVGKAYPLSLKDLCTVQLIPELIEAGIDSFKIEGRMKNAEYCAGVTSVYRAVMDRFFAEGKKAQGVTEEELALLRGLYVRSEIGDGYYHCQSGGHMLTKGKPGYRGCEESVLVMLRERYLEQKHAIPVAMALSLTVGEAASLTVCCDRTAAPCDRTEVTCTGGMVQAAAKKPLTEEEIKKQLQKTGGTPFTVTGLQISMTESVFLPIGQLNELRREALVRMEEALLARYEQEREHNHWYDDEQERENGRWCDDAQGAVYGRTVSEIGLNQKKTPSDRGYLASVDTMEQLSVCAVHPLLQGICAPVEVYEAYWRQNGTTFLESRRNQADNAQTRAHYLNLPRILRNKDTKRIGAAIRSLVLSGAPINGIYVHTAGEYRYAAYLAETLGKNPREWLLGSPFLYCMNAESARFWQERVRALSVPYELCERELYALLKKAGQAGVSNLEMPIYGHIPTMVTANCIVRSFDRKHCPRPEAQTRLKDRAGQWLHVKTECGVCLNTIYNSVPLSMHKHMPKLQKLYHGGMLGAFTLNFTMESAARTKEVLDFYMHPTADAWTPGSYTNGHFQRGVV